MRVTAGVGAENQWEGAGSVPPLLVNCQKQLQKDNLKNDGK